MRSLIATALLASAALATPAFAQDSAPAADKEFQGVKIVATTGVDHISSSGGNATGVNYGGSVGYDFQSKNVVFGIEGEVAGATSKDCENNIVVAGDRGCFKAGRDLYAGARAGVVVGKKALLYVKGGYANGRVTSTYTLNNVTGKSGTNLDGWRAGGGLEFNAGKNILVRAEYRYTNYSDSDLSRHQGLVGVGFKF